MAIFGPSLYSLEPGTFVSSLEMTNCEISILLHNRSDILCLAYSTAPWGSLNRMQMIHIHTHTHTHARTHINTCTHTYIHSTITEVVSYPSTNEHKYVRTYLSIRIFLRQVFTRLATSGQLSLLTWSKNTHVHIWYSTYIRKDRNNIPYSAKLWWCQTLANKSH